jgi:hypothetical protein
MCMILYAAADTPLPTLPMGDPPAPLSVRAIRASEEPVRAHFGKPHVYVLGAHTGCSCGFSYGDGGDEDAAGRESVRRLGAYLATAVGRAGPVELYACWGGDEAEPAAAGRATLTAADFAGDAARFALTERWLATVVLAAS